MSCKSMDYPIYSEYECGGEYETLPVYPNFQLERRGRRGATGPRGPQGPPGCNTPVPGATGPTGATGSTGVSSYVTAGSSAPVMPPMPNSSNLFFDTSNGDVYVSSNGLWTIAGRILGPTGPTGPTGPNGEKGATGPHGQTPGIFNGIHVPTFTPPVSQSLYVQTDGWNLYRYANGAWHLLGSFAATGPTGPSGPTGPVGEQGDASMWYSGAGPPVIVPCSGCNHMYLDTCNANVYQWVNGCSWSLIANIACRGKRGAKGCKGDPGATVIYPSSGGCAPPLTQNKVTVECCSDEGCSSCSSGGCGGCGCKKTCQSSTKGCKVITTPVVVGNGCSPCPAPIVIPSCQPSGGCSGGCDDDDDDDDCEIQACATQCYPCPPQSSTCQPPAGCMKVFTTKSNFTVTDASVNLDTFFYTACITGEAALSLGLYGSYTWDGTSVGGYDNPRFSIALQVLIGNSVIATKTFWVNDFGLEDISYEISRTFISSLFLECGVTYTFVPIITATSSITVNALVSLGQGASLIVNQ